jgi:ectoine hydroxylase-related dioxygenase (phytanoyl-CoA dioxygenase family)
MWWNGSVDQVIDEAIPTVFGADGAVCVRGLIDADLLERIAADVAATLADPSPLGIVASTDDDPGHFIEDFCNWPRRPSYVEAARAVAPVMAALMGSSRVWLHHDHVLAKSAGTTTATPWHQDQPYYDIEGSQMVSLWIPMAAVPRADSLEFLAGSHLGPWLLPRTFKDRAARWFAEGALADVPDIEADRSAHRILGWELDAGDAICFHALALHSAPGSNVDRRALSLRFIGDDARRVERPWRTSPPLAADAEFPLVFDASDDPSSGDRAVVR